MNKKDNAQARVSVMVTFDTIEEVEDISPMRGDHGIDSSSTSHRLVGN